MTDQELISNYKSANPTAFSAPGAPSTGSGWYAQVKSGGFRPNPAPAADPSAPKPITSAAGTPSAGGDTAIFGNDTGNAGESILKSTVGSEGIGGLAAKPIVSAMTSGAQADVAAHKDQLTQVNQAVLNKIKTMDPTDPKRQGLLDLVKENQKAFGISNDEMKTLEGVQETQGQNLGTALNAAATLAGGAGAGEAVANVGAKTIGQQIAHGAITGAEVGGAQGAGGALQDKNASAGDVAKGTLEGAALGGVTGGALEGIVPNVPKILSKGVNGAKNLVEAPISAAKNIATPIEDNVRTILQNPNSETESTVKKMFTQANKAVTETGQSTPFDTVGKDRLGGALQSLDEQLSSAGGAKEDALKRVGLRDVTPQVQNLGDEFQKAVENKLGTTIDGEGNLADAPGRTSLVSNSPGDARILKQVNGLFEKIANPSEGGTSIRKVNDAIDAIQNSLYVSKKIGAEPITSQTEGLMRLTIGKLNQAVKDATEEMSATGEKINPYADANAKYAKLIQLKNDLNTRLGTNMKNAGSVVKRIFSPQDGGTKDLVKQLEAATGQPIFHDATLAKFAMDSVGDPRAKSLLQTTMETKSKGITKSILDYLQSKIEDPQGKALSIIKKAKAKK